MHAMKAILSNYYFGGKALTWQVLKFYEKQGVTKGRP
jgi:hypothetical protein